MRQDSIDAIKQEIRFFMEKSFQVSLGYVGTFVALAAVVKLDLLTKLSSFLGISVLAILSVAVLLINITYLTLASACIFATLKRGYYILLHAPENIENKFADYRHWEIFVRIADPPLVRKKFFNFLAWNVDNYYMLPLFLFIGISSIFAAVYGWHASDGLISRVLLLCLFFLHIIPIACLSANGLLNNKCRQRAVFIKSEILEKNKSAQQTD